MTKDKYSATWVSHSSIGDFLRCPRAYYLRNVYKDKRSGHKITHMQPALALGQAVHEVVESLSTLPVDKRLSVPLSKRLDTVWEKVAGKLGGFTDKEEEETYKSRGLEMLKRVKKNPGPLKNKAVKIPQELPFYWISEEDNIILCGKIDWLEYIEKDDSVHIIDFKTGKNEESKDSLQLPIYYLLVTNTQKRPVTKMSYWYLARDDKPVEMEIPDMEASKEKVLDVAGRIKLGRQMTYFKCPTDGCFACRPLEQIIKGKGEFVGVSDYRQDIYILP